LFLIANQYLQGYGSLLTLVGHVASCRPLSGRCLLAQPPVRGSGAQDREGALLRCRAQVRRVAHKATGVSKRVGRMTLEINLNLLNPLRKVTPRVEYISLRAPVLLSNSLCPRRNLEGYRAFAEARYLDVGCCVLPRGMRSLLESKATSYFEQTSDYYD
jgi:hypothetical protein